MWLTEGKALLASVALGVWLCLAMPVFSQEAYYWSYAQHPALSYFDHPPMVAWLIWLGTQVLGDGALGIRVCTLLCALTVLLFALPFLSEHRAAPVAVVDPANCNGCARCQADCPYAAVVMAPHPARPGYKIAVVDESLCASCGICAGACPSSTPFRSQERLITGIDMPQLPVDALRAALENKLAALTGHTRVVVFGCDHGAATAELESANTATLPMICAGMLPPSFVEYALRAGADGVMIASCREGACAYRLGDRWTQARLVREREPRLRTKVPNQRIEIVYASANDGKLLHHALINFKARLATMPDAAQEIQPYLRRTAHHA